MNWWNELSGLQQLFASFAIPATLVMIIQLILLLFGIGHGDGADGTEGHADLHLHDDGANGIFEGHSHDGFEGHSHDGFDGHSHDGADHHTGEAHDSVDAIRLFTLRSIIAFFAVGGWMGVAAIGWKLPTVLVFILALLAGWIALYFVAWSIRAALRMQQNGNVVLDNAVGKTGEVYIPIPTSKRGFGKVNVIVQDRLCEFDAVTEAQRELKTGESITVTGVISENVLLVVPQKNPPDGVIIEQEF